jgi:hypothetical protein
MTRRARGRAVRALLAVLVCAGVIAAVGLAAAALARQAAASDVGSAGRTALTGADANISPTPSATPSGTPTTSSLSVNAGPDQTVTGNVVHLAGSVSDPAATATWSQSSGPPATAVTPAASVTFGNAVSPVTTATVNEAGVYVFQLTAADGSQTGSATVTITFTFNLNAGTFINLVYHLKDESTNQNQCTTGFGVSKAGANYELGAKHCIDNNAGNQSTNSYVATYQPMTITGVYQSGGVTLAYAPDIDCTDSAVCLLPSWRPFSTGDLVAWKPDTGVVVTPMVQTSHGLLPVVGQRTLAQVAGTQVCHYGFGSLYLTGSAEYCANAPGGSAEIFDCRLLRCSLETEAIPGLMAEGGDSGGPLYSYDYVNGQPVGVFAIGIVIQDYGSNLTIGGSKIGTIFIPIQDIEDRLGVTLLTQAPLP